MLDGFDEVKVCTGYRSTAAVAGLPRPLRGARRVEPVYETLPGWGVGLGDVREPAGLPPGARKLIELIEREVVR